MDLFTSWQHRDEFPELTAAVVAALDDAGYKASVVMSAATFARLTVTAPDGTEDKVELSADWRAHEPVQLDIGPVLHADDAVANKVCALFGRALPRDFLDVDAAVTSGRYTHEQLLELAADADLGFDRLLCRPVHLRFRASIAFADLAGRPPFVPLLGQPANDCHEHLISRIAPAKPDPVIIPTFPLTFLLHPVVVAVFQVVFIRHGNLSPEKAFTVTKTFLIVLCLASRAPYMRPRRNTSRPSVPVT